MTGDNIMIVIIIILIIIIIIMVIRQFSLPMPWRHTGRVITAPLILKINTT